MTSERPIHLPDDRYFGPDPTQKAVAQDFYDRVRDLPLICPHGHVDPRLFADPHARFGSPAELLIVPDHYVFRMLYSQGVTLEDLGVPTRDGGPTETDHRKIWQRFAEHYSLFRGTPSGQWLAYELKEVLGVEEKLTPDNADRIYDQIAATLAADDFTPRKLYERFNVEVLCTTDAATDSLQHHRAIRDSGWHGRILPTFRPDGVVNLEAAGWRENIEALGETSGIFVQNYASFIEALEARRAFFKSMGAVATDHAATVPHAEALSPGRVEALFQRALRGEATPADAAAFTAHMLIEHARMSAEDGLVMQLHTGALRDHNPLVAERFGADKGADIPFCVDFAHGLRALLERHGNDPRLRLIVFTLNEATYARELAPLAGHYPALRLGPPWWFHDSLNGIARYFDSVIETAGLYNTVGFNDDTRAFASIPARHDVWRRAGCNWIAGMVVRGIVDDEDAAAMAQDIAYRLAKDAYNL